MRDLNRVVVAALILMFCSFGYAFVITRMYFNAQINDEKMHQYLLTDTEQSKEDFNTRMNDLQSQIVALDTKIENLNGAIADTKRLEMQIEMNEIAKITDLEEYYLAYSSTIDKYSEYVVKPPTIYDTFTESEIYLLQRMVETETCGVDFESKTHVANVAFNRLMTDGYPNTLSGVITADGQFAYGRTNISESTRLACEYAYLFPDNTQGALAFHSGTIGQTFCGRSLIFVDRAGHGFYR